MKKQAIKIGEQIIGPGEPCFLIAEVGLAHDGSLAMAHSFIDAASKSGADAVKFQMHIAEAESTLDEPFRIKIRTSDKSRYDYWRRTAFTPSEWAELKAHCDESEIGFLCSPFSREAVDILREIDVGAWKIASGEVFDLDFISYVAEDGRTILLSTGMSAWRDIRTAVDFLHGRDNDVVVMQCTSRYPSSFKEVGLNVVEEARELSNLVGLSDHSGHVGPGLVAISRKASVVEVHVTFSKDLDGPDSTSSLDFEDLSLLASVRDAAYELDSFPVEKDQVAKELKELRQMFGRSVALKSAYPRGTKITSEMLVPKKPGMGIPWSSHFDLLGKILSRDVSCNRLLRRDDLEN